MAVKNLYAGGIGSRGFPEFVVMIHRQGHAVAEGHGGHLSANRIFDIIRNHGGPHGDGGEPVCGIIGLNDVI